MTSFIDSIKNLFIIQKPLPAGVFYFHPTFESGEPYRLNLRIDAGGTGLLIINASTVLHLNQTATEYAYYFTQNMPQEEIAKKVAERYRISKDVALKDFLAFKDKIENIIGTPDLDPVQYLNVERTEPYSGELSAPYRLDCALTYRSNDGEAHAPMERVTNELGTAAWRSVIKKAFDAGIPQIIFTGGEPTLREDLPELLAYAEELGLVTGLLTDGEKIANKAYLQSLLDAGLDHVMILFQPEKQSAWQNFEAIHAEDIFTTVHLTLTPNVDLKPHLERLASLKVNAVSLSTSDPALVQEMEALRNEIAVLQIQLVWDLPVPYSKFNSIALEIEDEKINEGAGNAWLYVEPDGDVLPAQGVNIVLGNIVQDAFQKIWKNRHNK